MTRKLAIVCVALAGTWLGNLAAVGRAQDPILAELYGSGVHEFFSGSYPQAINDLTEAINGKSRDPRVYYFRALAYLRLSDSAKAQADFIAGAKLESADIDQYYPVSKSLERVQGSGRLMLERYRVQARAETYRRQEKRNLARYEAQRRAEAEVLRATPPPPAPGGTAPPAAGTAPPDAAATPAGETPAEMPATDDDPFATDDPDTSADAAAMPDADEAAPEAGAGTEKSADAADEDAADEMPGDDAAMTDDSGEDDPKMSK